MFVKHYNNYMKRNDLNHSDKNLVKFRRPNPPRKWEDNKKKEKKAICFEFGKPDYYKKTIVEAHNQEKVL